MKRNYSVIACALGCLLAAGPRSAAVADWYVGANVGQSGIDASVGEIEDAFLIDDAFVATDTTLDDTDTGFKAFAGYRFVRFVAVEAGYVDLGKATFNTTIVDAPAPFDAITPFQIDGTATVDGPQVSALLELPLAGPLTAFARAGAFRWEAEFTEFIPDTNTIRVARTEARTDPMYGVGLQLAIGSLGVRLEWERLENVGEGIGGRSGRAIDFVSAGLLFEF